jgi:hypothetical protein
MPSRAQTAARAIGREDRVRFLIFSSLQADPRLNAGKKKEGEVS